MGFVKRVEYEKRRRISVCEGVAKHCADALPAKVREVAKSTADDGCADLIALRHSGQPRARCVQRQLNAPAYRAAGWRDAEGNGGWTRHSLRHVFCTTALFTWKLDPTDVSRMAGHANYRTTLDMYVGSTAGVLDRARAATE